jgi:hypothetical protein
MNPEFCDGGQAATGNRLIQSNGDAVAGTSALSLLCPLPKLFELEKQRRNKPWTYFYHGPVKTSLLTFGRKSAV